MRIRKGRFADAAACLAKAMQANPQFSVVCVEHAAALALADRGDEAKAVAQRVLELEPQFRAGAWERLVRRFMLPELCRPLMDGVRLAGLPE